MASWGVSLHILLLLPEPSSQEYPTTEGLQKLVEWQSTLHPEPLLQRIFDQDASVSALDFTGPDLNLAARLQNSFPRSGETVKSDETSLRGLI